MMIGGVFTIKEIRENPTAGNSHVILTSTQPKLTKMYFLAFHELDEYTFRKAVEVLVDDGRARTFERKGKLGITFFALR